MNEPSINAVRAQLCPTGALRAAINMTNGLLVTAEASNGDPVGVSPDMAALIAKELDVPLTLLPYPGPGYVADALLNDEWDIGNIAAEPERAKTISFSSSYCEIQATYLVLESSTYKTPDDVDSPGVRIAAKSRAAYELWLQENLKHATLETSDSFENSKEMFVSQSLDALAGLRPPLLCKPGIPEASSWINEFVQRTIGNGTVQRLIDQHGVTGRLSVSPLCG